MLTYVMVAWLCVGMLAGIWQRSANAIWSSTLSDVRWKYDVYGLAVVGYGLLVAFGLFRRLEWARVHGASLCCIIVFGYICMPVFAAWRYDVPIASVLHLEGVVIGTLAAIDAFALTRGSFRAAYSAHRESADATGHD